MPVSCAMSNHQQYPTPMWPIFSFLRHSAQPAPAQFFLGDLTDFATFRATLLPIFPSRFTVSKEQRCVIRCNPISHRPLLPSLHFFHRSTPASTSCLRQDVSRRFALFQQSHLQLVRSSNRRGSETPLPYLHDQHEPHCIFWRSVLVQA